MNFSTIDLLSAGAALLAVMMCGFSGLYSQLRSLALQTAFLAGIAIVIGTTTSGASHYLVLAGVVLLIKSIGIPLFLAWSAKRLEIPRDAGIMIPPALSALFGVALLVIGYFLSPYFAVPIMGNAGEAGMTLTLIFIGMLLMITRRLAISQVIGFLVLENGIFLYGLTQTHGMPMLVEMASVFEVLMGVIIAGLVTYRINRTFEHVDVTHLRGLRH
jgi:hydrogenase-4 component E